MFSELMRDSVTLVKADGSVAKRLMKASVEPGKITTFEVDAPIERGDHFLRKLPNGMVEDYIIEDSNYISGFPPSYQTKVRRSGQPAAQSSTIIHNITANFTGNNARLNYKSTDNSVNSVQELPILKVADVVEQIRPFLSVLPEAQRKEMEAPVSLLEQEIRSGTPDQAKMRGALQSIKSIAEGAIGNLIASGIVGLVGPLLAGVAG